MMWYAREISFLNEPTILILFLILLISLLWYLGEAATQLLSAVYSSVQILSPQQIQSGLTTTTIRNRLQNNDRSVVPRRTESDYRDEYTDALESNEELLSAVISRWEDVHQGFLKGVLSAIMVAIIYSAVNFKAPEFLFLSTSLTALHGVIWAASSVGVDTLRNTFRVFPRLDLTGVVVLAYMLYLQSYSGGSSLAATAGVLIGLFVLLVWSIWYTPKINVQDASTVLIRNLILCLSIFIVLVMMGSSFEGGVSPETVLAGLIFVLVYQIFLILVRSIQYFGKKAVVRIWDWGTSVVDRSRRAFARGHWSSSESRGSE